MTNVYRVEDVYRSGPYKADAPSTGLRCGETAQHPYARSDGLEPIAPNEIFVFRSLDLLVKWFREDRDVLRALGYRVVEINIRSRTRLRHGNSGLQSVYRDDLKRPAPRRVLDFDEVFG